MTTVEAPVMAPPEGPTIEEQAQTIFAKAKRTARTSRAWTEVSRTRNTRPMPITGPPEPNPFTELEEVVFALVHADRDKLAGSDWSWETGFWSDTFAAESEVDAIARGNFDKVRRIRLVKVWRD